MEDISLKYLLDRLNIAYTDRGSEYQIRCINPSHPDRNPSMGINKKWPFLYNCFSCGEKGNVYTFVKTITNMSLREFLKQDGIDWKSLNFKQTLGEEMDTQGSSDIKMVHTITGEFENCYLVDDALMELKRRGISKEFVDHYNIECSPNTVYINGTRFFKRICIPIMENGEIVNYEGRTYNNSKPKVLYCKGGSSNTLFDIDNLKRDEPLIIVEGVFDLPAVFEAGYRNISATFGSSLSNKQIELLNTFDKVIIIPDNDDAGECMIEQLDECLEREFYIAKLSGDIADPGDADPTQIEQALRDKVLSINYVLELAGLRYKPNHTWNV